MLWRALNLRFESCVVLDGSQTVPTGDDILYAFESCVVLDGSQTDCGDVGVKVTFESCVVLDGSQTPPLLECIAC